jgi:homoserine kinase
MGPDLDDVTVETPSTVGNFGPGFDVTALALARGGDTLHLAPAEADAVTVTGPGADDIPGDWDRNCASVALEALRDRLGVDAPVELAVEKGVPPGSGLGSSASSSAGGALALASALDADVDVTLEDLLEAARAGEAAVAGAHGDDVAAALAGGVAALRGSTIRRVEPPEDLHLGLVVPRMEVETRRMREAVPERVAVADATANLAALAHLVDACHRDDVAAVGTALEERIATPHRAKHLPHYEACLEAAQKAGAHGAALAGSGPAVFAVTGDEDRARQAAEAMREAAVAEGVEARAVACEPERRRIADEVLVR